MGLWEDARRARTVRRVLAAALLISGLSFGAATSSERARADGSSYLVVNSTADDTDPGLMSNCATGTGDCTLRAAIDEHNAISPTIPQTITFAIPITGTPSVKTIQISSPLTVTAGNLTIDGYTQPGAVTNTAPLTDNAQIMIEIKGQGPTYDGFYVTSDYNTFRGLAIYDVFRPFYLDGPNASHNRLVGDFIGTNAAGTFAYGYQPGHGAYNGHGVSLFDGASYNQIGDVAPGDRNVISGNGFKGICMEGVPTGGPTTSYNVIYNNIIGLSPSGGPFTTTVHGNTQFGNSDHGIDLNHGASYNIIGGTAPGQRNVISGNGQNGIEISHPMSTTNDYGNQIVGNYVGTDVTGSAAYTYTGNLLNGINVEDGAISTTVADNVVGNNGQYGVALYSTTADNTYGNTVHDNWIGVTPGGTAIPNGQFGLLLGYIAHNNVIGPNNVIANNAVGIDVTDSASRNTITQNSIYANGGAGLGISLAPGTQDGVQPPSLNGATPGQLNGTACITCTVEIFLADQYGQGQTYLVTATVGADGTFSVSSPVTHPTWLTATATDALGNTSAFAAKVQVVPAGSTATPTTSAAPTSTATNTPVLPTATSTNTPVVATNTPTKTSTPIPPTSTTTKVPATSTYTPVPSTRVLPTRTPVAQATSQPATHTPTPTATAVPTLATKPLTGRNWAQRAAKATAYLRGIACVNSRICLSVGDSGVILVTANGGAFWLNRKLLSGLFLKSIACASPTACQIVGDFGGILRTVNGGVSWIPERSGVRTSLNGVACPTARICYAVGAGGMVLTTTNGGVAWSHRKLAGGRTLYAVACPTAKVCYIAGISGRILKTIDGGKNWRTQASHTLNYFYGLACPSVAVCYAVGGNGTIAATSRGGTSWVLQKSHVPRFLRGIACAGSTSCIAVGDSGTVVVTTNGGKTWQSRPSGTKGVLRGVSCAGKTLCVAIGGNALAHPGASGVILVGQIGAAHAKAHKTK